VSPIVLAISRMDGPGGNAIVSFRVEQPYDVANAFNASPINDDPAQAPFATPVYEKAAGGAGLVQAIGEEVCKRLLVHPGVDQLFTGNVALAPNAEPAPIFIRVDRSSTLPWETLYHPQRRFLALDPQGRWPIARIPRWHAEEKNPKRIEVPIRIAAVLAATNRQAKEEWDALYAALATNAIDFRILVLVAEDALEKYIRTLGDARIDVRFVPDTPEALTAALKSFRAQIVHFFAHGLMRQGPQLEIATRGSHDGSNEDHVYLNAEYLKSIGPQLWLVVLNACRGADASGDRIESLAFQLVLDGVPAAIGMRDVIDLSDARTFTRAFYAAAVEQIAAKLGAPGVPVTFRWADALRAPRSALCRKHGGVPDEAATTHAEWTLPVLYVRHVDAQVEAVHTPALSDHDRANLTAELTLIRAALSGAKPLHGGQAPQAAITMLTARAAAIEAQLGG
jgi:hypothetical protein